MTDHATGNTATGRVPRGARCRRLLIPAIAMAMWAPVAVAAGAESLDALLEQTRSVRQQANQVVQARDARFQSQPERQAELLEAVRAELAAEQQRASALAVTFDADKKQLADMQAQLETRAGEVGEIFGAVRQVANDFASVLRNSIISAQFPQREDFVNGLAEAKVQPDIRQLEQLWFEMQREMTETGVVAKFVSPVVAPSGASLDQLVTRVGPFSASSDGQFLAYLPSQRQFTIMTRQPGPEFQQPARALENAASGYVKSVMDPTRGVILNIYAQQPQLRERIEKGESVGYVILLIGLVGSGLALYQLGYLTLVRMKVRRQLTQLHALASDNPLGRVLATFKGDAARLEEHAEAVELRVTEAVLKELPRLERFQQFLRLSVASGPLLGLVGTVMGMIVTFQSITETGSSDPKLMANGISQAMIATLLGLGIAVPLLFANAWLASISRTIVQMLEEQSVGLLVARVDASKESTG